MRCADRDLCPSFNKGIVERRVLSTVARIETTAPLLVCIRNLGKNLELTEHGGITIVQRKEKDIPFENNLYTRRGRLPRNKTYLPMG